MQPEGPQPQVWFPQFLQPGKHDIAALKSGMRDVTHRIAAKSRVPYSVAEHAPGSYQELKNASTSPLVIYAGASERTIYGEPSANWAQRAIHDTWHLKLEAGTDPQGELRVALAQALELARISGDILADFAFCDTAGQTWAMQKFGCFPVDQIGFVVELITTGRIELF
jgi:hypothetical protein